MIYIYIYMYVCMFQKQYIYNFMFYIISRSPAMAGLRHPGIGLRPSGGGERVLGEVSEKGSCLWPLASADRLSRLSLLSHQSRRVSMSVQLCQCSSRMRRSR